MTHLYILEAIKYDSGELTGSPRASVSIRPDRKMYGPLSSFFRAHYLMESMAKDHDTILIHILHKVEIDADGGEQGNQESIDAAKRPSD